MATHERFDESVSDWLEETAPARLPERVLTTTFERTRRSRQHVGGRAILGRSSRPRLLPALGSAAVVLAAAALALNLVVDQQGRVGADDPTAEPTFSDSMWPQSSLEEVREAQERADAGDPAYTWQVDPELESGFRQPTDDTEIVARFLQEELGWQEFRFQPIPEDGFSTGASYNNAYIRCAPGRTNPMYPNDPVGSGCAPTIDDVRYERVSLDLRQLVRQDPSGIWVVTRWAMIEPFEQAVRPSDTAMTELLEAFLQARIEGEGAEEYVAVQGVEPPTEDVPLLYATTTGAAYERSEREVVDRWVWPDGGPMRVKIRLFAEGGETVVEQSFLLHRDENGRLGLRYEYHPRDIAPTTENGQVVPVQYSFLDGEVTFRAAWPWDRNPGEPQGPRLTTLVTTHDDPARYDARLAVVADPRPIENGCDEGPPATDAQALAESIRSDPDLEATAPVAVSVGGVEALRLDVATAPRASFCEGFPGALVVTGAAVDEVTRMRLYLLDLPGGSPRVLAIAITGPAENFDEVMNEESPIVASFEFHAR